jgi:hypothetical protein
MGDRKKVSQRYVEARWGEMAGWSLSPWKARKNEQDEEEGDRRGCAECSVRKELSPFPVERGADGDDPDKLVPRLVAIRWVGVFQPLDDVRDVACLDDRWWVVMKGRRRPTAQKMAEAEAEGRRHLRNRRWQQAEA